MWMHTTHKQMFTHKRCLVSWAMLKRQTATVEKQHTLTDTLYQTAVTLHWTSCPVW